MIPYGWGHDNDGMKNHKPGVPLLDQAILKDDNVYAGNHQLLRVHQIDSLQIEEVGTDEDEIVHVSNMKAQIEATSEDMEARQSPIPKDIFDESLGWSLQDMINEGDADAIKKTNIAQPYIFAISYCYGLESVNKYGNADALIGHSLGEYTALAISGFFDYVDVLKIISVRGEAMQESVENSDTGMAAVLTTDLKATLKEIEVLNSQDIEVWISNYNDASQIVISSSNEKRVQQGQIHSFIGFKKEHLPLT